MEERCEWHSLFIVPEARVSSASISGTSTGHAEVIIEGALPSFSHEEEDGTDDDGSGCEADDDKDASDGAAVVEESAAAATVGIVERP